MIRYVIQVSLIQTAYYTNEVATIEAATPIVDWKLKSVAVLFLWSGEDILVTCKLSQVDV